MPVTRSPETSTNHLVQDDEPLAILERLVTDVGAPRLVRLIAAIVEQHARQLLREGASPMAARVSREAAILSRAAEEMLE
jgi:hypothetical protein